MLENNPWTALAMALGVLGLAACDDDNGGVTTPPDAPAAPTGVQAAVVDGGIQVTWSASANATSYTVQRSNVDAGGAFADLASSVTGTSYTDMTAEAGIDYGYRVRAVGEGGTSNSSDPAFAAIPVETGPSTRSLTGNISGERVLSADTVYLIRGVVRVGDGGALRIPAGTLLRGDIEAAPSAIFIERGGQLFSEGTEASPVVFTSGAEPGERRKGDWAGVVVNGRSICNFPADDCVAEGGGGAYGGDDLDDDSGRIVYTRIEYAGYELSFGNELNALTLNGVGAGTEIHHVQTHGGLDDGFEWFGGTVDAKYLLATDISDDSFDFSTGWRGRGQFWVAHQDPDDADTGYEVDGNEDDGNATPYTNPTVFNVTLVGKGMNGEGGTAGESTTGMLLRRGTAGTYRNHIVIGFGGAGFDIDNDPTATRIDQDSLVVSHSIIFGNAMNIGGDDDGIDETAIFDTAGWANRIVDPELTNPFDRDDPDFRPASGSPALEGYATPPADDFFDAVDFIGAVGAGSDEWYKAPWTRWGAGLTAGF